MTYASASACGIGEREQAQSLLLAERRLLEMMARGARHSYILSNVIAGVTT